MGFKIKKSSRLKRQLYPMPANIMDELKKHDLVEKYYARPPYQRNDYIGWITRAKKSETQKKRLDQMIAELKNGSVYMKMKYNPKK